MSQRHGGLLARRTSTGAQHLQWRAAAFDLQRPSTHGVRPTHCGSSNCSLLQRQQQKHRLPQCASFHGSCGSSGLQLQHGCSNAAHPTACRSSSFNNSSSSSNYNGQLARDSVDIRLPVVEADSWQQLHDVFYGYGGTPSYEHCYAILIQLAELLPEMQLAPGIGSSSGLAGAASGSGNGAGLQQPGLPSSSNSSSSSGGWDSAWQALHARGKVQSLEQVTQLQALLRDVQQAVQLQMHLYEPHELLDIAEAAVQLARPSQLWMQAWMSALLPHLQQLQLGQLVRAAAALLACGGSPSQPWAELWLAALQPHLYSCTSRELCLISMALKRWSCKPPDTWNQQFLQIITPNMSAMGIQELLAILGACITLHLKPSAAWLQGFEAASQEQLGLCNPGELVLLLQGLSLLGYQPAAAAGGWLQQYLAAVDAGLSDWDVQGLGSMLSIFRQLDAGQEAVQLYDSTSSTRSGSSSSSSGSSSTLLAALAAHAEPLIESTADPGALVDLLRGFFSLNFIPSDAWLDLLLDEAAEKISVNSTAHRVKFYGNGNSTTSAAVNGGSRSMLLDSSSSSSSDAAATNSSTSSSNWMDASADGGNDEQQQGDEEPWLLPAGSYQPSRNINLARRSLESSWQLQSKIDNNSISSSKDVSWRPSHSNDINSNSSSSFAADLGSAGAAAGDTAPGAAVSVQAVAASSEVVRQVLGLLSVVAAMKLPVERGWVADVMRALQGHGCGFGLPGLQQLLALLEVPGPVLEPEGVDELLVQCQDNFGRLPAQDMLRLLRVLAGSQTRPNDIWWQGFLATLQVQLPALKPAQLVTALVSMCEMGGRPPQSWLASHEAALLNTTLQAPSTEALSPKGWLLLLECYSRLMYRPSTGLVDALEGSCLAVLPDMGPEVLASLVCSAARLQLPLSPQLEGGIMARLEQVLRRATPEELQQLTQGLLLLELQLPPSCLHCLCDVMRPHLAAFSPNAICSLLQLLAVSGESPTSPGWLSDASAALQPQLPSLEPFAALLLLQSLKAFTSQPPAGFMAALQQRLLQLVLKFDAMEVAVMLQGLVACGVPPSAELQAVLAGHIKKELAQPSQGMDTTPIWLCLEALLAMQQAPSPLLLDELLHRVAQQLRQQGTASTSEMAEKVLPRLAAAVTAGGVWGSASGYTPSPGFWSALCDAALEDPSRLPPLLWLDLLVRFSDLAADGSGLRFKPNEVWCEVATQQVFAGWGLQQQQQQWARAPAVQLAALLGAAGRLQHNLWHLPGWPGQALWQLSNVMPELGGHQISVALIGVAQQQAITEMAVAAAAVQGSGSLLGSSYSIGSNGSTSTTISRGADNSGDDTSSSSSSSSSRNLQGFDGSKPQLIAAAEAASLPQLPYMDATDLAVLGHALQQLGASPAPQWVAAWSAAAAAQLPGMSGQACVLVLSAAAAFQARPNPTWVQLVLQHCQQQLSGLQLQELVVLARSLQLLGFRLDQGDALSIARAGQARAAAPSAAAVAAAVVMLGVDGSGSGVGEKAWEAAAKQRDCLELQQLLVQITGRT